ncbi:hypothetical protein [Natrinema amylolyticum]|uniref:hypothetical protein n=1 Tax=Natrinema amylolyticum TaxID=2878679 RepID=UPI001CF9A80E|nr:hypothetical protein [Natrinema amylolyticum]
MTRPSRRALLCGTASAIALSAGCIADGGDAAPSNDTETDGGDPGAPSSGDDGGNGETDDGSTDDGEPDDDGNDGDDQSNELVDSQSRPYQYSTRSTSPEVTVLSDRDRAERWLDDHESLPETVVDLVDETDFETSTFVRLEAGAPNPCHEMTLESIAVEDGRLALEGAVRETSDDDEACIARETTVGRLVRATFDGEPLTDISASIVDRNGDEYSMASESESGSASAEQSSSPDETSDGE